MNDEMLAINCTEWRGVAGDFPGEMEVVVEMMIEAEEELCKSDS